MRGNVVSFNSFVNEYSFKYEILLQREIVSFNFESLFSVLFSNVF